MPHVSLAMAAALSAGLACGVLTDLQASRALSVVLAAAWAASLISFVRGRPRELLAAVVLAVLSAGWLLGSHAVDRALHPPLRNLLEQRLGGFALEGSDVRHDAPILVEGTLAQDASPNPNGVVLRVHLQRIWLPSVGPSGPCPEPVTGGVTLSVGGALQADHVDQWRRGRTVRAPATLRRPARYLNRGLGDQERALARRGITLVGSIKSATLVEVVERGPWWEEIAAAIRARIRGALNRHVRPRGERSAAIATAILIGDRAGIDPDVEQRLQEAGTYHVIAISGGNIAILAGLQLAMLAWIGVRGWRASIATLSVLVVYAAIASGGASVTRATLMACVYLGVRALDHRTAPGNAIAVAGASQLLTDPLTVVDVGFWLTFGATAAIVVGASCVSLPRRPITKLLAAMFLASVCAELVLAPISAAVFQRITVAGLLLNFAAIPAMTLAQIGSMAVVALDLLGLHHVAEWLGIVVHGSSIALTESARLLEVAPWMTWRVPSPPFLVMATYYAAIALAVNRHYLARRFFIARLPAILASMLFLWIVTGPPARVRALGDGQLHVTQFDVGQGDALLVTFPNGRRLLVDAGGSSLAGTFDVGDRVVGPTLRSTAILGVDYLAITHGDPDHIGGARSLVRDFRPLEVWWGVPVGNHAPTRALTDERIRTSSTWRWLQRGDRFDIGGVEVRVHHPPLPDWERRRVRNNDSLVLELRHGAVSVLLTGDIDRDVERELIPMLDLLPIVALKVAHHGSGTSSTAEFIQLLRPKVATIGVGRGNPYGHPVPHVLERLGNAGAEVFRTDLDGEVMLSTDGRTVRVETFTGRRWESGR
jgi:competence protein ComEC